MLEQFGSRYVWAKQSVGYFDLFIVVLKNRLSEFYKKKWYNATRNSSKLAVYATYKYELEPERYLDVLCIRKYFVAFSRLRCSSHNLRIESGRYNNTELAQRICTLCNLYSIEGEFHFLMNCTAYTDLFNKYIAPHISDSLSSYENVVKLMQSEETICTKDVACYIYIAFILRKQLLNNF